MSDQPVLTEIADGILTITLNRPAAKNAANKALAEGVAAAIDELESNPELRVAILTISCDLIVAADDSKFGIPEVKRGLAAGAGGLAKLPKQIPPRIAKELALTGDFISAQRAYDLGLINQVVPSGTALQAAKELAQRIAANGPLAVAASKQVVDQAQDWSSDDMFARQNVILQPIFTSEDAIEGATAFAEKRAPQWKGR